MELKQGMRDNYAYAQHTQYLVSCIMSHPIDAQIQVTVFVRDLADSTSKTCLFRLAFAIFIAEQVDFSLKATLGLFVLRNDKITEV